MLPSAQIMYRGLAKVRFASSTLGSVARDLGLPEESIATTGAAMSLHHEIRLQGIRFAYPTAPNKWILDRFDLVIPANGSVGIVGKSGAGKSTLMDILLGLLHPQDGTMSVDGVPITAENTADWQRTVGYVPQHIYLSDSSVAENIAFGVPREAINMTAVERAARAAQIHDFVTRELPQGYATQVGDRGIRLSGGQRQRIGIARALYRDPAVLLMDEATSALDEQTEEALNEAIRHLSGSKTIIVIAHKKASLQYCQQIITISRDPRTVHTATVGANDNGQPF
jgi:ABC-type bacteriocin/lantibiotic exporter with double-glycine peptidase domain